MKEFIITKMFLFFTSKDYCVFLIGTTFNHIKAALYLHELRCIQFTMISLRLLMQVKLEDVPVANNDFGYILRLNHSFDVTFTCRLASTGCLIIASRLIPQ